MSGPAPAAERAFAVVTYLTANARRSFTLSELSVALGINKASLSAILATLTDGGYLARNSQHRTYSLGPAMIAAGLAAAAHNPVFEVARVEMERLAAATACQCVGSVAIGQEMLILANAGEPTLRLQQMAPGQRVPLTPPYGEVFVAWGSDDEVDEWFGHLDKTDASAHDHLRAVLERVRQRGCAINLLSDHLFAVSRLLVELDAAPHRSDLRSKVSSIIRGLEDDYELLDAQPQDNYRGALIAAPVFGPDGSVIYALTLSGLLNATGRQILDAADMLASTTLYITQQVGGRVPLPETGVVG
ncbi:MAG: transcriptional regulator, IclR family [Subtercola sp.]|nr:transcriptional regulator, IclR family [Subtercola sp.]